MKQGWEIKKLGEVCIVIAGQSPEGKFYNSEKIGLPFYQGKKEYGEKYIGEPTTWTTKITKEAEAGDILMSVRAPVGPVNFATQKICIGRGLAAIRAGKNIDKNFLFNFLIKHENEIVGNVGAVFNSINKTQIENLKIPLPPLPEQQRIVSILDECFAAIDKAKTNAEQNLKNAKELFESYLQGVFEKKGNGWEEKKLGEVCEVVNGGTPKTENLEYWDGNIKWITPSDLGKLKSIIVNNTSKKITDLGLQKSSAKLLPAYSVILSTRAPIGHLAINTVPMSTNQGCRGIIPNKKINFWYLYYFLKINVKLLDSLGTGATFKELSANALKNVVIPFPKSLEQQQSIVRQLDALRAETQKLETIYKKKISDIEELKKSILQKAFAGELKTEKAVEL